MNDWKTIRKTAIVEADDFQDKYDRNGLEMLFYWKAKWPKFKISLFTVPNLNKTSKGMLNLVSKHSDWIELLLFFVVHEGHLNRLRLLVQRHLVKSHTLPRHRHRF